MSLLNEPVILTLDDVEDYNYTPAAEYVFNVVDQLQRVGLVDDQPYATVDDARESIVDLICHLDLKRDEHSVSEGYIEVEWAHGVIALWIRFGVTLPAEEDPDEQDGFVSMLSKVSRGCEAAYDIAQALKLLKKEK